MTEALNFQRVHMIVTNLFQTDRFAFLGVEI